MDTHADGDVDGCVAEEGAGREDLPVSFEMDVRLGAEFEGEGDGGVTAVDDAPEEDVQRGGSGEEGFGKEGTQTEVAAGEGGEVAADVATVAGWTTGQMAGGLEEEFVGECEERHHVSERLAGVGVGVLWWRCIQVS